MFETVVGAAQDGVGSVDGLRHDLDRIGGVFVTPNEEGSSKHVT